jgi:uncharacterized membrane protein YozB (DUF420 family)
MDARLVFWTASLANLGAILACALVGLRLVRRGEVAAHRRCMLTASALVGLFLVAYLGKVALIGHEDRSAWSALDYAVLHVHELCIAGMLGGGVLALVLAHRFRPRLGDPPSLPAEPLPGAVAHRRAGRTAIVGGLLAFLTAAGVLAGMFSRAG